MIFSKKFVSLQRYLVPNGSIGNRVEIPDSSRCCKLLMLVIMPLIINDFGKAARIKERVRRPATDRKQSFRDKSWLILIFKAYQRFSTRF